MAEMSQNFAVNQRSKQNPCYRLRRSVTFKPPQLNKTERLTRQHHAAAKKSVAFGRIIRGEGKLASEYWINVEKGLKDQPGWSLKSIKIFA